MKLKACPLLLILLLSISSFSCAEEDSAGWYPFSLPEKMDPGSPLNIGRLVLDGPAGRHGFVRVKDGHLYFEDGERAKFWGTNLCFDACFPDRKQAEIMADRLAFFGFNAVRLHHMDFYFEPRGIFEDVCPAHKDPQMKETGHLSKRQLDKLDYLIYRLKLRGIYIDLNLLVARHFTEADGVKDAGKLGMAAKPFSMFDPKLIELQKKYARDLLTHYNTYTKLRYCDDPAIALVEIVNEASLSRSRRDKMPDYYRKELESMKDVPDEEIEKRYYDRMVSFLRDEIGVKVPITGSQYSSPRALSSCDFIDKHAYWDHPKFPGKQWDIKDFTIHNKSIFTGKGLGIVENLVKARPKDKPYTVTEWNHCYPNEYAYETPVLLAAEALKEDWDALFQFAYSHGRNSRPASYDIDNYFNTVNNPQKLILTSLGGFLFLKGGPASTGLSGGVYTIKSSSLNGAIGFIKNKPLAVGGLIITADQDGAILLLRVDDRYILFAVGEVEGSGSGWNTAGKFDWGKAPALMKRINVTVRRDGKDIPADLAGTPWTELKL